MSDRPRDKYDDAIDELMAGPIEELGDRCTKVWYNSGDNLPGSALFYFASPDGTSPDLPWQRKVCGCLTQLRTNACCNSTHQPKHFTVLGPGLVERPDLAEEIEKDERLPGSPWGIKDRAQLEACADWQRRLDREIRSGV